MTASLLEEVEKRRTQPNASRVSTGESPTALSTTTTAPATVYSSKAASSAVCGVVTDPRATTATTCYGGKIDTAIATPGGPPAIDSRVRLLGDLSGREKSVNVSADAGKHDKRDYATLAESSETAVAVAAGRQRLDAERRRAALATIEQHRSHTTRSTVSRCGSTLSGKEAKLNCASSVAPVAETSRAGTSRLSTAFSPQSVRWGATLGYYGREEVETLFSISKNPSRVAAYNRIIEGKQGNKGEQANPEVRNGPL